MNEKRYENKVIKLSQFVVYDVISNINHKNLKDIEIQAIEDHNILIKEEYIKGESLRVYLENKKLSKIEIHSIIIQLLSALEALHLNKIIHRDIKPENIVIGHDQIVRLIDYDISRVYVEEKEQDTTAFGTRGYAPPEQFGFSQSDDRSDIYALGIVLKELDEVYSLALEEIYEKCCDLDPQKRFESVSDLRVVYLDFWKNQIEQKNQEINLKLQECLQEQKILKKQQEQIKEQKYEYKVKKMMDNSKYNLKEVRKFFDENYFIQQVIKVFKAIEILFYLLLTISAYEINLDTFYEVQASAFYLKILNVIFFFYALICVYLFYIFRWRNLIFRWIYWVLSLFFTYLIYEFILELGGYYV